MDEPTIEMWRALLDFRARHGRYWKHALSLKWMDGSDEQEQFSASLRKVRNLLGPTWLYALKPAVLDAAAVRIARFDRLPEMCATHLPGTGEAIVLKRGEAGYWPLPEGWTVARFNAAFEPTSAQIAAMEAGSLFGWDVPVADPANYDSARSATVGQGRPSKGKGVRKGCGEP